MFWGSDGEQSTYAKMTGAGFKFDGGNGNDCGPTVNPCTMGMVSMSLASMLAATSASHNAFAMTTLKSLSVSTKSVSDVSTVHNTLVSLYGR